MHQQKNPFINNTKENETDVKLKKLNPELSIHVCLYIYWNFKWKMCAYYAQLLRCDLNRYWIRTWISITIMLGCTATIIFLKIDFSKIINSLTKYSDEFYFIYINYGRDEARGCSIGFYRIFLYFWNLQVFKWDFK